MRLFLTTLILLFSTSAYAGSCMKSGEQKSGMNKICYYRCLSGTKAITVGALEFCPLSIDD